MERLAGVTVDLSRQVSIARARHLAAGFLTRVQAEHGLPVSQRAMDLTQLVVSELVTNAHKYAPGPALMDLRIVGDAVEVVVWDGDPVLPVARAADAGRVGQHGLEIVMAVPTASKCSGSQSASASPPVSPSWTTPAAPSPDADPCRRRRPPPVRAPRSQSAIRNRR